jgi:hypothetical protein
MGVSSLTEGGREGGRERSSESWRVRKTAILKKLVLKDGHHASTLQDDELRKGRRTESIRRVYSHAFALVYSHAHSI